MAFTALAAKAYKDPITTVWANSIQGNDDYLFTAASKAWVNFDGSAAALSARSSLNISSITDVAAGVYIINFTTGFSTSGYCILGGAGHGNDGACVGVDTSNTTAMQSGSCQIQNISANAGVEDSPVICAAFFGIKN